MKKTIFIILFLFTLNGVAQKEKDSLLKHDIENVVEKLNLMHFLEKSTGYFKSNEEFKIYFDEHIYGDNDDLKTQIKTYLDPNKPLEGYTMDTYISTVNDQNALELIEIINSYGWPSESRINRYVTLKRNNSPLTFVMHAKTKYTKKIKRLSKEELKLGHMTQATYDIIEWQASAERYNTNYLRKKGYNETIKERKID